MRSQDSNVDLIPPFILKTPLERVNVSAQIQLDGAITLHWGGGGQVAVIFGSDQVGLLPGHLASLVLPLLQCPGIVEFSVQPWHSTSAPPGSTAVLSMVEVRVTPTEQSRHEPHATTVRNLEAEQAGAAPVPLDIEGGDSAGLTRRTARRLEEETSPTGGSEAACPAEGLGGTRETGGNVIGTAGPRGAVNVSSAAGSFGRDLLCMIVDRLSWKDIFGQVRRVSKPFREAADSIAPQDSARIQVAKRCVKHETRPSYTRGGGGGSQATPPDSRPPRATPPSSAGKPSRGTGNSHRLLPSEQWLKDKHMVECSEEDVLKRQEDSVRLMERQAEKTTLGRVGGDGGGDGELEAARKQAQRLRSFWEVIRRLCAQRRMFSVSGNSAGDGSGAGPGVARTADAAACVGTPRSGSFGVRARAVDPAEAPAAAVQVAGCRSPSEGESRWSGWVAFALAVVLSTSEDRPFICRCAIESWGEPGGLPRSQVIELLCRIHLALMPRGGGVGKRAQAAGFQAASGVSVEWDGKNSYRLWSDLLTCILALEEHYLRLPKSSKTGQESDRTRYSEESSGKPVDLSRLTPEQLEAVYTDVCRGERMIILAFAGTGKTLCLRAWAQIRPGCRILCVTFSKSASDSANRVFPTGLTGNVTCWTLCALAGKGKEWAGGLRELTQSKLRKFLENFGGPVRWVPSNYFPSEINIMKIV